MRAFDRISQSWVTVMARKPNVGNDRCVLIRHKDGGVQIQFKSLLTFP
jgi:hypothetical protein